MFKCFAWLHSFHLCVSITIDLLDPYNPYCSSLYKERLVYLSHLFRRAYHITTTLSLFTFILIIWLQNTLWLYIFTLLYHASNISCLLYHIYANGSCLPFWIGFEVGSNGELQGYLVGFEKQIREAIFVRTDGGIDIQYSMGV